MLGRIALFATRHPRAILLGALAVAVLAGLFGATAASHLKSGGFVSDDAESLRASRVLEEHFPGATPNYVLLVDSPAGVDTEAARDTGQRLAEELRDTPAVEGVQSYWTTPAPYNTALRGADGNSALVLAAITGDETEMQKIAGELTDRLAGTADGVTVRAGGPAAVYNDVTVQTSRDLAIAEAVAIPLSMIVLILVFGSLIAAALPLAVGLFAIAAALAILRLFTLITDVSIYALNMTTALGLALAIDYSLFIVSRYREELAAGRDVTAATVRAVQTAGRTVLFSALTVALSLAALSVFNLYFLKSFAYAGVAVVAAAAVASILILPAALVLLGHRVNSLDLRVPVRRLLRRPAPTAAPRPEDTGWYRLVSKVMRHPIPFATIIIALLLVVGSPFLNLAFGYPDDRVLPTSAESRQVGDELRSNFPQADPVSAVYVVLDDYTGGPEPIAAYAKELAQLPDVPAVLSSAGTFAGSLSAPAPPGMATDSVTYLTVSSALDPYSEEGARHLEMIRAVEPPVPALYSGAAVINDDALSALGARLPIAAALIAFTTLLVLFLFTGSVVLPVKALVLNTFSLTAAFGAMVWVFQEGHLSGLLGFTAVGYLVPTMPILMFCLAFGLSMDYEVFLLSRIREEWLRTGDNTRAVALGVARTGRIITAAALLMAIVLGAMITSKVSFMQLMGLGLTLTVLVDATVIRGMLAPALMRLLGTANWWAPAPLAKLHAKIGLTEDAEPAAPAPSPDLAKKG
ncbi:MMPL family transporter [Nocardia puris]|uniref:MMPL family transporter n=1 Tax=Nocardia puris TaxID=208602 RepID=UPI0018930871|nr:MMPL family transporter [Nocardia puris]MBF6213867.1 MMPL family transporter [Nocardia puris]MBF6368506.1 MMPL family transporter [Nocardia puris]MBF6462993.1 MMPL family transporter [Nocardia puris]